eukprot:2922669-Alexandrium_andersonii.AAC.1
MTERCLRTTQDQHVGLSRLSGRGCKASSAPCPASTQQSAVALSRWACAAMECGRKQAHTGFAGACALNQPGGVADAAHPA